MARKASLALIEESQTRWAETADVELHGVGHVATLRDNLFLADFHADTRSGLLTGDGSELVSVGLLPGKMRAFMPSSASSGR